MWIDLLALGLASTRCASRGTCVALTAALGVQSYSASTRSRAGSGRCRLDGCSQRRSFVEVAADVAGEVAAEVAAFEDGAGAGLVEPPLPLQENTGGPGIV
jgi:hypothetical protein